MKENGLFLKMFHSFQKNCRKKQLIEKNNLKVAINFEIQTNVQLMYCLFKRQKIIVMSSVECNFNGTTTAVKSSFEPIDLRVLHLNWNNMPF